MKFCFPKAGWSRKDTTRNETNILDSIECVGVKMFAWEYKKTLPMNPDREPKSLICVGLTAHAIRLLKILRIFAQLMNDTSEVDILSNKIEKVEMELNDNYWSDENGCYLDRIAEESKLLEIPWIYDYLPLLSGTVPDDRKKIMLNALFEDNGYWGANGFTILKPDSPFYRDNGYPNGSIWPPIQYFFWKMCYCIGEMNTAKKIADKFLKLVENNHKESLCVCEHFRANTGKSAGNMRFSSFMTPAAAMWKALRQYGAIQTSYDIIVQDIKLDKNVASVKLLSLFYSGRTGFSIVLEPNKKYTVKIDNEKKDYQLISDDKGYLGLNLDIQPNKPVEILLNVDNL